MSKRHPSHSPLKKLREGYGGNNFAVRFVDVSGVNLTDLSYQLDSSWIVPSATAHIPRLREVKDLSIQPAGPTSVVYYGLNGRKLLGRPPKVGAYVIKVSAGKVTSLKKEMIVR